MYNISYKYKSWILFLIKVLIVGAAFYFISLKLTENKGLISHFENRFDDNMVINSYLLLLIFLFTIVNWSLEILKWKTLMSSLKNITFINAIAQSLSSLTASLLTPNRIGEYGAKAVYYDKNIRYKVMFLNFLGNLSQMFTTIFFGFFALILLWPKLGIQIPLNFVLIFAICLIFSILFLNLFKNYYTNYILRYWCQFKNISNRIHVKYLGLSLLRYLIFSHQFYFLLLFFGITIDYIAAMPIIFAMYFIASIIPSFVIFDWIIKGSVAVAIFHIFGVDEIIILSITSLMWLLNFAFPSILGSYFVLTFKPDKLTLKENRIRS